jgi:crotonobetainyl-CoA:carnitine CoA-transferase CaiB-like acyl-CoA transferase
MNRPTPLQGVRVVDLTQVLAGPYCSYQLALLGAEVLKIEPPGGEWTRVGGALPELSEQRMGLSFCTQNSDKQCLEIDLKDPAGVAHVLRLVADADIFIQNYRPGVAERLGLGVAAVQAQNPKIVYCSISAYGGNGPIGHRPAYDHVVQAMSGIMRTTGTEESGPTKVGAPYVDYGTGLNAAFAVLAALRERDRTGEAQTVDVSMLDTTLNLMASNLVTTATTGQDLPPLGNEAASRAPSSGCFLCSDDEMLMLAANNERQFRDLCAVLGHEEWADDSRWSTPASRSTNQEALRELISVEFKTADAATWESRLDAAGVPASKARRMSELLAEGQPQARGLLHDMEVGASDTPVKLPGIGFRFNGHSLGPQERPHDVGEDNQRWSIE